MEEFAEEELEVAAILCGLKKALRARERRWRRRMQRLQVQPAAPEIPSWGRRRPRSMPEEKQPASPAPAPAPAPVEKRDGAASPNTPLAYPESGGDDAPAEEEEVAKKPASLHDDQVSDLRDLRARAPPPPPPRLLVASLSEFFFERKKKEDH